MEFLLVVPVAVMSPNRPVVILVYMIAWFKEHLRDWVIMKLVKHIFVLCACPLDNLCSHLFSWFVFHPLLVNAEVKRLNLTLLISILLSISVYFQLFPIVLVLFLLVLTVGHLNFCSRTFQRFAVRTNKSLENLSSKGSLLSLCSDYSIYWSW